MALELQTGQDDAGRRLDRVLRKALPALSLSALHRLLRTGRVLVAGAPAQAQDRLKAGDKILLPDLPPFPPPDGPSSRGAPLASPAGAPPWGVLGEGAGLLVLNKPPGVLVHGPDSLETTVRTYLAGRLPPSLSFKPGPLHRLDRQTSGVIAFSTSLEGARRFSALLREGLIHKRYLALVEGKVRGEAVWEDRLFRDRERRKTFSGGEGQAARSRVSVLATGSGYSLLQVETETGRTHQIRAQAALHGCPLAGDRKYGGSGGGFFLHALALGFPPGAMRPLPDWIEAPVPAFFCRRVRELFGR